MWFSKNFSPEGFLSQTSFNPSLTICPGAIALNLIPYLPHSDASDLVRLFNAAFEIEDGTTYPEPVFAYVVVYVHACCIFVYACAFVYLFYFCILVV